MVIFIEKEINAAKLQQIHIPFFATSRFNFSLSMYHSFTSSLKYFIYLGNTVLN